MASCFTGSGILYAHCKRIGIYYNKINEITGSHLQDGGNCNYVTIEGNHGYDRKWSFKDDYCPRAKGKTIHGSFISIRDTKDFIKPLFDKGLHTIDTERFVIHNAHGLYIPNHKLVPPLMRQSHKKRRAIDHELKQMQLRKEIKYFIYPAISSLHIEDANKGFTWSSYKLPDTLLKY